MNEKIFVRLCLNYGKEPNKELYEFWKEELEVFNNKEIELAFNNIMKIDKYFPTLSRIYEELRKIPIEEITEEEKKKKMTYSVYEKWENTYTKENEETYEKVVSEFNKVLEEFRKD